MAQSIPCAGAIVFDGLGRLLLVRRANDPGVGLWSLPGGRCDQGESAAEACIREVAEETGLTVRVVRHVGSVTRPAPGDDTYAIDDFLCTVVAGDLRAGDDAADARWVTAAEISGLHLTSGLAQALRAWDLWPR
ncbi:MAG TPA: NUDIX domain-containing protein [Jatrophihabitantaceae bacterium]|jgi:ADP-ribose pyrophosphatase YjhB (NUDIX family)|nr:NUDIX domain-containing protein [Jatrophihabitantaceae bacterium]